MRGRWTALGLALMLSLTLTSCGVRTGTDTTTGRLSNRGTSGTETPAGELEGAAARLEWDQMPRKPCCARLPASEARTFAPLRGAKVTAFCRLSEKSWDFSDSLRSRAQKGAAPIYGTLAVIPLSLV